MLVIRPADALVALPEKTIGLGELKLAWFRILKTSARNCSLYLSVNDVFLNNDMSKLASPGPLKEPLPTFPQVPDTGKLKAAGLNHWFGLPVTTLPVKSVFTNGRTGLRVSPEFDGL